MMASRFFGFGTVGSANVQVKSPFDSNTKAPLRTSISSPGGTSLRISLVLPGFSGSGTRPLNRIERTSPEIGKDCSSLFSRSKILPVSSVTSAVPPLSLVLKRWPSSVGE